MSEWSEQQLLAEYVRTNSEDAFRELVQRNLPLVYNAALRIVRDPGLAEDLAQEVFTLLSKKSAELMQHPTLCGWLHLTTRNLASKVVRTEVRRRVREEEVTAMQQRGHDTEPVTWEELAPELDAWIGELSEPDREALLLRFFQNRSAREIGEALGIGAEAAQKRVSRALERLRNLLSSRGVAVGSSALVFLLEAHAANPVPNHVAGLIVQSVSTASHSVTSSAFPALVKTPVRKWPLVAAALLIVVCGVAIRYQRPSPELQPAIAQISTWVTPPTQLGEQLAPEVMATAIPAGLPIRDFPESSWNSAGFATPEQTLLTYMWAKKNGDVRLAWLTASPDFATQVHEVHFRGKTDEEIATMLMESAKRNPGFQIRSERRVGGDTALIEIYSYGDPADRVTLLTLRKTNGEWRVTGFSERVGTTASTR